MATISRKDQAWLQTGWERNQGRSSQMRHYRSPAPSQKGASKNSILQCNKMSVKAKQVDDKARQIRLKYGKSNLERELNKKKGIDMTPFVTKVQIRKTLERNKVTSAGRAGARIGVMIETPRMSDDETIGENNSTSSLETVGGNEKGEQDAMLSDDIIVMQGKEDKRQDDYVQNLIKCLTRRLKDPFEASRTHIPPTRPIAAYARPTKGEIALSVKGPVILAPVSKVVKTTGERDSLDRPSRFNTRSLPEFAGSRTERAHTRPISSVSDSVVVTGRKLNNVNRAWLGCEHAQNNSFNPKNPLCSSCRAAGGSNSDTRATYERAKSALPREGIRQIKNDGRLPQLDIRQTPSQSLRKVDKTHSASPKRNQRARNGMISPFELQVHLNELTSYDYGSPVPPPSMSNSDDEEDTS